MFGYEKCGCVESESKRCVDIRLLWFMVKASTRVREYDTTFKGFKHKYESRGTAKCLTLDPSYV